MAYLKYLPAGKAGFPVLPARPAGGFSNSKFCLIFLKNFIIG
jgi:hypothetical protein